MRLNRNGIFDAVRNEEFQISPLIHENVGPASIDLRLGRQVLQFVRPDVVLDSHTSAVLRDSYSTCSRPEAMCPVFLHDPADEHPFFVLRPGHLYLAHTEEIIYVSSRLCGTVAGRSSGARWGIEVESAGFVDPGFRGPITLEITVCHPIRVYPGDRICQLILETLAGDPLDTDYGTTGRYNNAAGVGLPRSLGGRGHGAG